jgi:hypothetical protein
VPLGRLRLGRVHLRQNSRERGECFRGHAHRGLGVGDRFQRCPDGVDLADVLDPEAATTRRR